MFATRARVLLNTMPLIPPKMIKTNCTCLHEICGSRQKYSYLHALAFEQRLWPACASISHSPSPETYLIFNSHRMSAICNHGDITRFKIALKYYLFLQFRHNVRTRDLVGRFMTPYKSAIEQVVYFSNTGARLNASSSALVCIFRKFLKAATSRW